MSRWPTTFCLAFLAVANLLLAGAAASAADDEVRQQRNERRFSGWNGIAFYCDLNPDAETSKRLCEWAGQRMRLAASSASIPFIIAPDDSEQRYLAMAKARRRDALQVELKIFTTKGAGAFGAYVRLAAKSFYISAKEGDDIGPAPEHVGRPAELFFWTKEMIGAAYNRSPDLDADLRGNLETQILALISDFAEGRAVRSIGAAPANQR